MASLGLYHTPLWNAQSNSNERAMQEVTTKKKALGQMNRKLCKHRQIGLGKGRKKNNNAGMLSNDYKQTNRR